jgi:hypothetical protein
MPEQEAARRLKNSKYFPVCHKMSLATVMIDKYMAAFFAGQMRSL